MKSEFPFERQVKFCADFWRRNFELIAGRLGHDYSEEQWSKFEYEIYIQLKERIEKVIPTKNSTLIFDKGRIDAATVSEHVILISATDKSRISIACIPNFAYTEIHPVRVDYSTVVQKSWWDGKPTYPDHRSNFFD